MNTTIRINPRPVMRPTEQTEREHEEEGPTVQHRDQRALTVSGLPVEMIQALVEEGCSITITEEYTRVTRLRGNHEQ